ncbi:MAG: hypothetical protein JXA46_09285 [Dehalococcoidales bacterium]|nr:hypothetical protein [Dehalococcoidales bacterium]
MTVDLIAKRRAKLRTSPIPPRQLEVDNFDNALNSYISPLPVEVEIELSEMPEPKRTRMVELKIESRRRAKFESSPIDLYSDIEN